MSTHRKFQDQQSASPRLDSGCEAGPLVSREDGGAQRRGAGLDNPPLGICFKCAVREPMPGYRVCAYCFKPRPQGHPKDESFDCGCSWNFDRYVTLGPTPDWEYGLVARPPDRYCVACRGSGRITDRYPYLKVRDRRSIGATDPAGAGRHQHTLAEDSDPDRLVERELLAMGGFQIEKAGSTGRPMGRPVEGVVGRDAIARMVARGLTDDRVLAEVGLSFLVAVAEAKANGITPTIRHKSIRPSMEMALGIVGEKLNGLATAEALGIKSRQTVRNWMNRGEKRLQQELGRKSPKGGRNEMSATIEDVRDDLRELREELRREFADLYRVVFAFRFGETPAEAWERVLTEDADS